MRFKLDKYVHHVSGPSGRYQIVFNIEKKYVKVYKDMGENKWLPVESPILTPATEQFFNDPRIFKPIHEMEVINNALIELLHL